MQLTERERKLTEARKTAALLVAEVHQVPVDLSRGPLANVTHTLTRIRALTTAIERTVAPLLDLQEFRE